MVEKPPLAPRLLWPLRLQILLGNLMMPLIGYPIIFILKFIRSHRLKGRKETMALYRQMRQSGRPIVICANHLTFMDSVLIHHALNTVGNYIFDFRSFSWNIPAVENFHSSLMMRFVAYLGACIPLNRNGSSEHTKSVIDQLHWLLVRGHSVTIFPEGTRSRSGRIELDKVNYGVGNILLGLDNPLVLCIYCRGDSQIHHSVYPVRKANITILAEPFEPKSDLSGRRAARDISVQIIEKLYAMEQLYYVDHPDQAERIAEHQRTFSVDT